MTAQAKRLLLHLGLPKTGTKALQAWLRAHRDTLLAAGICYPDMFPPGYDKHVFMMPQLMGKPKPDRIAQLLDEAEAETILLSNEGLSNHFYDFDVRALERFRATTSRVETILLFATRSPERWLASYYKQCVLNPKNGASDHWGTDQTLEEIRTHPRIRALMNHDQLLSDMMSSYGAREVWRIDFDDPGWFPELLARLGIDGSDGMLLPRINSAIPDWAIEALRQINRLCPKDADRIAWKAAVQKHLETDNHVLLNAEATAGTRDIDRVILKEIAMPASMPEDEALAFTRFASALGAT